MPLYQLNNIVQRFGERTALWLERWQMRTGEIVGLVGPNGSGKSTLLKLLGFIHRPTQGEIIYNGRRAEPFTPDIRNQVSLLPQDSYLLRRSVYSNVAYGLRIRSDRTREKQRVYEALALVGLSGQDFAQRPWFALSGGEARRVALAARLILRPQVLLLDEPTASVDSASAHLIKEAVLKAHRQWETTLVVSSHDDEWLEDICHSTLYLFEGKSLGEGKRTFLFGPWRPAGDNLLAMELADAQAFVAARGPHDENRNTAGIDPGTLSVSIDPPAQTDHRHLMQGLVLRISLDRPSRRINLSVLVGNTVFPAQLSEEALSQHGALPGRKVWLAYDPHAVQWH